MSVVDVVRCLMDRDRVSRSYKITAEVKLWDNR